MTCCGVDGDLESHFILFLLIHLALLCHFICICISMCNTELSEVTLYSFEVLITLYWKLPADSNLVKFLAVVLVLS